MSPAQLDKLGDKFATEPGLRRPVQVRQPRRRRQHHGDQVAVLLRQEERPPRQDRLQGRRTTPPPRPRRSRPATCRSLDRHRLDAAAGDPAPTRGCGSSSRRGLGYQGITLNIGNKNGLGKLPYSNVGTRDRGERQACARRSRMAIDRKAIEQGRLRRHRAARLHAALAVERLVRRRASSARRYNPARREEARAAVRDLEPDRAPDGADRHGRAPPGAVPAGPGEGGRDQRRDRLDRLRHLAEQGRRRHVRDVPDRLVGPRRPGRQHLPVRRTRAARRTTAATRTRGSTSILNNARKAATREGAADALPRRAEDHPRRPAADLPVPPDHLRPASRRKLDGRDDVPATRCSASRSRPYK